MQLPLFSIVICTYNRAEILGECLKALAAANQVKEQWELLVVNNNSSDQTATVVDDFLARHPLITGRNILETRQGLSHSRNRGYQEAVADWVFFLDDDAKVKEGLLERLVTLVNSAAYQVVGGVYYPWYHFGRPRWFRDDYASNALPYRKLSKLPPPHTASGGVMLWKKTLLEELGGFDPRIGMKGAKIAYGEETYLQEKARERGVVIAYDPELVIFHIVMKAKLNVDWFFVSYFAAGRDAVLSGSIPRTAFAVFRLFFLGAGICLRDAVFCTPKLLSPGYFVENWLIDVFRKPAKRLGSIYTILLQRNA